MKTTIQIPDNLFREVKRLAVQRGTSLKALVESALRRLLKEQKRRSEQHFRLRKHPFKGKGLREGIHEGDWSEIRRRVYAGRGG